MTTVNLADGRTLNFPDGTDPAVIQKTVKQIVAGEHPSQTAPQAAAAPQAAPAQPAPDMASAEYGNARGPLAAFGESLANGLPAGGRLTSAMAAGGAYLSGNAGDMGFGDLYNQAQADSRATAAANPKSTMAGSIVGGIPVAIAGGGVVNSLAPETASALQAYTQAHPYLAAAGLGAGSGALYGAGAGGDTLEAKAKDAAIGGLGGAALGPAVTFAGRNIVAPVAGKIADAGSALQKFLTDSESEVPQMAPESAPTTIADLQKPNGDFFSKTAGEKTQSSALQTVEADAVGRRYGEAPAAAMANARSVQNQERTAFISALDPKATDSASVNDVLDGVYNRINGAAESLDGKVNSAYDLARQGNSVKIGAGDIQSGLLGKIGEIRNEMAVNLSDKTNYSKSNAALDALAEKLTAAKGSQVTAVKLGDLEDWRKTLTNYANDSTGTEKAFLSKVRGAYDDFMFNTANNAADVGDKDAILAFRNAVGMRRLYGNMFEKNKIVESIANGASPDDFAKSLIGSGAINGKRGMMDNVTALVKAGGDDGEAVKGDLATAFAKRLFAKASQGYEDGKPDTAFISPAKMASGLDELFVKNKQLGEYLFGKGSSSAAQKAIAELKLISSKQPGTQNPSGSGYMIARVLRETGITKIPVFSKIPLAAEVAGSFSRAKGAKAVEQGLQDFITKSAPRSALFSAVGGAAAGVSSGAAIGMANNKQEKTK